jgi:hypothetical protein
MTGGVARRGQDARAPFYRTRSSFKTTPLFGALMIEGKPNPNGADVDNARVGLYFVASAQ